MLLRIVDLRERFGTSDEASAPSGEGGEVVEIWRDGPALEGELESPEIFCFDVVWPIWIQVSTDTDSGRGERMVVADRGGWERGVEDNTDRRRKPGVCRIQR